MEYGKVSEYQMDLLHSLTKYSYETLIANTEQPGPDWVDMKEQARQTIKLFVGFEWVTPKTKKLTKRGREVLSTGYRGW